MKAKVTTGKGFSGLIRYVSKPGASEFLGGTSSNPLKFKQRASQLVRIRPDCKTPVLHFSLSQPAGENLTDAQWHAATDLFIKEMKLDGHDHIYVRHSDTSHDHIHLVVSKINPAGSIWNERNSARRAMAACTKIEQKLGLTRTRTLAEFQQDEGRRRNVIRDGSTNEFRRTGKVKSKVQLAIQKRKAHESDRKTYPKSDTYNGRLDADQTQNQPKLSNPSKPNQKSGRSDKKIGSITSRPAHNGEVVFKKDNIVIASLNKDRTAIEVFSIDQQAIDFAIHQAVRSGQIPLEIYGSKEFIEAASARASALNIPYLSKKGESEMKKEPTALDRLAERLNKTETAIQSGNIHGSELEWRTPRTLSEWLNSELKLDRSKSEFELLDLARRDHRITQDHINEVVTNQRDAANDEQNERSAEQHHKMKG